MKNPIIYFFILVLFLGIFSCSQAVKNNDEPKRIETSKAITERVKEPKPIPEIKPIIETKNCVEIIFEIIETSTHFLEKTKGLTDKIIKNGGTSYGLMLEGSPNPIDDDAENESETYDFNLHETYPDHSPIICRYSFNLAKKQLFLYDPAEDEFIEIEFDKKRMKSFNKSCQ